MTAKEYCTKNEAIGVIYVYDGSYQVHGIEYGIEDYAYISHIYIDNYGLGKSCVKFHRVMIRYNFNGEPYVIIDKKRAKLNNFIRTGKPWGYSAITCKELLAIC